MKITELSLDERPRERLLSHGPSVLSNGELLAVLLRSGTPGENVLDLARRILSLLDGSLVRLSRCGAEELRSIPGIKDSKASILLAAFELGRRFMDETALMSDLPITDSEAVYRRMIPSMKGLGHEECSILLLDRSSRLIARKTISTGNDSGVILDCRDVVRAALEKKASSLILTHNHPSGNPLPSRADLEQTELLKNACEACGISLLDHVIISNDRWYSFAEEKEFHLKRK